MIEGIRDAALEAEYESLGFGKHGFSYCVRVQQGNPANTKTATRLWTVDRKL